MWLFEWLEEKPLVVFIKLFNTIRDAVVMMSNIWQSQIKSIYNLWIQN